MLGVIPTESIDTYFNGQPGIMAVGIRGTEGKR